MSVNHLSRCDGREPPASRTARIRTTCRSKQRRIRRALTCRWGVGLPDPAQSVRRYLRGAKLRAAGMGLAPIPWRQAKRAAPQARRREGLKPNGCDGKGGTGRSPKARRRIAPTRPGCFLLLDRPLRCAYGRAIRKAEFAPQVATVKLPSGASARPTGLLRPSAITVRRPLRSTLLTVVPP